MLKYIAMLVGLVIGLSDNCAKAQEPLTIEKVWESPSSYKGQTLVFDNVRLSGDLSKKDNFYLLNVKTPADKVITANFHITGLTMTASFGMGANLEKETAAGTEYLAKLTCKIKPRGGQGKQWLADVVQVDFYGRDGKVRKTIDATPPGKAEDTKNDGITGKWKGPRKNEFQGDIGEDFLFIREFKDGKLAGEWRGMTIKNGVRLNDAEVIWEADGTEEDTRYRVRAKATENNKVLSINYTFFYKQSGTEKSYEGSSRLVKEAVAKEALIPNVEPLKLVSLFDLDANPAKFDGQTFAIRCDVAGKMFVGKAPGRHRITVKAGNTTVTGDGLRQDGINVVIPNLLKDRLLGDLKLDEFYPVQLTVTVRQETQKRWFAVVSEVERESTPEPLKVVSLKEMLDSLGKLDATTFIIDRVNISGEIKKQTAGPGYHIRLDPGNGKYTYQFNNQWNGCVISSSMAKQMMSDVSAPGKYMVKLTCKLNGEGKKWQGVIQQIDFYDSEGTTITKTIK